MCVGLGRALVLGVTLKTLSADEYGEEEGCRDKGLLVLGKDMERVGDCLLVCMDNL